VPSESYILSPPDLGDGIVRLGDGDGALVNGGGSMPEPEIDTRWPRAGSGSAGISSPADDVSMVICLVGTANVLK
jgi:hypothetical protein